MMENGKHYGDNNICDGKENNWVVPYLVVDIMFNIFMSLPARKLQKLRYGCKEWYKLISSNRFIAAHLHQSKCSLVAISINMTLPRETMRRYFHPDTVRIDEKKVTVRTLRIKSRKIVVSSCNGLLLLEDMKGNLNVSNPVTGEMLTLPPCIQRNQSLRINRGMTFIESTEEYKVVSAVLDKEGREGWLGCEMLTLGSTTWKWVRSPFDHLYSWHLAQNNSISIKGVFHIVVTGMFEAHLEEYRSYVVSFDTLEKKFYKSTLPPHCRVEPLHEIGGCLSIVVPNRKSQFCEWEVLALTDLSKDNWDKLYSIDLTAFGNLSPRKWFESYVVATTENGRFLILERQFELKYEYYVYDVQLQRLRSLKLDFPDIKYILRPHVESLLPCPRT